MILLFSGSITLSYIFILHKLQDTQKMEHRYTIHEITPFTRDWSCKIQVVDKIRPKISRDHRVNFQTTIVLDENEDQICIITYGPEVAHYDNLFKHFHTYLISAAKVREPSRFAIPMHNFEWVLDTFSIVEEVIENNEEESMLPLPSRLNMVSFADIEKQIPGDEFVVANCGTMKYQGSENRRFQEAILIDDKKKPFLFTIWGELADKDGTELLQQLHRYPVIVAKRIAISNFKQDVRLTTRFNSLILIDPLYPQAAKLMNWVKDNNQMLIEYTLKSTSASPSDTKCCTF
ncbi:replication protein A 70 kDa DNA-binding subunit B-like isoform X4 [Nicotiana tomentosiformis]|uniref:replication protein A 70 kDa DNA-binding subunit B-like isoform X4 n=1 Tax=Nicotiana tomentosiformis TaxID=4098 RepID=UPI00388C5FDE